MYQALTMGGFTATAHEDVSEQFEAEPCVLSDPVARRVVDSKRQKPSAGIEGNALL